MDEHVEHVCCIVEVDELQKSKIIYANTSFMKWTRLDGELFFYIWPWSKTSWSNSTYFYYIVSSLNCLSSLMVFVHYIIIFHLDVIRSWSNTDVRGKNSRDVLGLGQQWDGMIKQLGEMRTPGSKRIDEVQVKPHYIDSYIACEITTVYVGDRGQPKRKMFLQTIEDQLKRRKSVETYILEKEAAANAMIEKMGILAKFLDERSPVMMGV